MVLEGIMTGLSTAFTLTNILMVSLGVFAGTLYRHVARIGSNLHNRSDDSNNLRF